LEIGFGVVWAKPQHLKEGTPASVLQDGSAAHSRAVLSLACHGEVQEFKSFVKGLRENDATPHVARKIRYSAIDSRTTRYESYNVSQRKRKRVEEIFG
jgi:hypothetical protein